MPGSAGPSEWRESGGILPQRIDLGVEDTAGVLSAPVQQRAGQSRVAETSGQMEESRTARLQGLGACTPGPHHRVLPTSTLARLSQCSFLLLFRHTYKWRPMREIRDKRDWWRELVRNGADSFARGMRYNDNGGGEKDI